MEAGVLAPTGWESEPKVLLKAEEGNLSCNNEWLPCPKPADAAVEDARNDSGALLGGDVPSVKYAWLPYKSAAAAVEVARDTSDVLPTARGILSCPKPAAAAGASSRC